MLPPAEAHPSPQRDRQSKGAQKFVHGSFSSNDQSPRRHWWQSLHFQLILDPPARRDHKKLGIGKLRDHQVVAVEHLHRPAVQAVRDFREWTEGTTYGTLHGKQGGLLSHPRHKAGAISLGRAVVDFIQ